MNIYRQLGFETWAFGEPMTPDDKIAFLKLFYAEFGHLMTRLARDRRTDIKFETYEVSYDNKSLGQFSIGGEDIMVLRILLFLIQNIPAYCKIGIGENPNEPTLWNGPVFFPSQDITKEDLVKGLQIEEQYNYLPIW
ncbi:hypothetical protein [Runella sp.]|uniref:hypothetical protein n=1 Tax=Runella sp. TaxID=1960881 RepID=UPI003D0B5615